MTDPWIAVAVGIGVLSVFLLGLLVPRRQRTVRAPITDAKLDAIHSRLATLETKQNQNDHDVRNIRMSMQSMPTKDSLNQVRLEVAGLTGKVDGMHDTLTTNGHSLRRIEDFLINAALPHIAGKGLEAPK
ncbi:DUF2730 family protein [Methylobacterium sp. Leaf85]|uniref:DUF2730 family protein n=1 Tax=Methylobacterium sp. Leaf85 TaxID=1736241 RepID=UPI0006F43FEB|nr:DUF2730 family protein [Methylobacterium sp. Leaf85]KQO53085.1 hypothetical protein ASF08_19360 [Methylobacterium sp. Leaf85]